MAAKKPTAAKEHSEPVAEAKKPKAAPKAGATATAAKSSAKKTAAPESNGKAPAAKKAPAKAEVAHADATADADAADKMKRKGSFLVKHFSTPKPLVGADGKPTPYALKARDHGEKIPKTEEDTQALAAKGQRLLEKHKKQREKEKAAKTAEAKSARDAAKAEKAAGKK